MITGNQLPHIKFVRCMPRLEHEYEISTFHLITPCVVTLFKEKCKKKVIDIIN